MAKRKRLTPSLTGLEFDPDLAESSPQGPLEVKAFLRFGLGAPPPIARVAGDAATQAALDEVTQAMASARAEGRLVLALPLDTIDTGHLVRDRLTLDEDALAQLMASIRDHGQRTPIEVTDLGQGRYGLISGWRRMQALHRLNAQGTEPKFGSVLALLRHPADASDAYVAMVEENEVRQGLSYYERARVAARAVELGIFDSEKQALQRLFSTASRARRSKIGSFLSIYHRLDAVLRFPAAIPERLGLALAKAIEKRSEAVDALVLELQDGAAPDAATELDRLGRFAVGRPKAAEAAVPGARREMQPGVFLDVSGGWTRPVLTLSGPSVGPDFRDRLEQWLAKGD
ncbi:MAG: ParB/RepB/Spo0J family partition protein [Paracoccaceae bacterium]